jgi:hypothetical protein
MAKTVTVELTSEQVQQMLFDGRAVYPNASNAELEEMVVEAAKYHGIFTLAREWRAQRVRQTETVTRKQELAEHETLFPPTD